MINTSTIHSFYWLKVLADAHLFLHPDVPLCSASDLLLTPSLFEGSDAAAL